MQYQHRTSRDVGSLYVARLRVTRLQRRCCFPPVPCLFECLFTSTVWKERGKKERKEREGWNHCSYRTAQTTTPDAFHARDDATAITRNPERLDIPVRFSFRSLFSFSFSFLNRRGAHDLLVRHRHLRPSLCGPAKPTGCPSGTPSVRV